MGFSTIAIHAGNEPDTATGAVSVPIYQTSTYAQEASARTRAMSTHGRKIPTRSALERNIAALEGAKFGFAFASGMAAIDTVLKLVKGGDHVILGDNTYGGTYRLFNRILANYGVEFDLADTSDVPGLEKFFKPNTKMVFVETPTNPVMTVTDLKAVSELAHASRCKGRLRQHFHVAVFSAADRASASTSSFIRRRNISTAIRTVLAALSH